MARIALLGELRAHTAMMIDGPRRQSFSGWFDQARAFYVNLIDDDGMIAKMANYGYTKEKLEKEFELMKDAEKKNQKQGMEMGEAQEETRKRDEKLDELDKWVSTFRSIAKVALEETPQKLESLGILVLNAPRAKKPAAAKAADTAIIEPTETN